MNNHYHILERTIELLNESADEGKGFPLAFCPLLDFAVIFDCVNMIEDIWRKNENFPQWISNLILAGAFLFTVFHFLFLFCSWFVIFDIFVLSY